LRHEHEIGSEQIHGLEIDGCQTGQVLVGLDAPEALIQFVEAHIGAVILRAQLLAAGKTGIIHAFRREQLDIRRALLLEAEQRLIVLDEGGVSVDHHQHGIGHLARLPDQGQVPLVQQAHGGDETQFGFAGLETSGHLPDLIG